MPLSGPGPIEVRGDADMRLIGVAQYALVTTMREAGAPLAAIDDVRIALDEVLFAISPLSIPTTVRVGVEGSLVRVEVLVETDLDLQDEALPRVLVDRWDLQHREDRAEVLLERRWD